MRDSLIELFCDIDDFCQQFIPDWERQQLASQERQRRRAGSLSLGELMYLMGRRGEQTGISFIDATSLVVCYPRRIQSHKVFKQVAQRGKTSTGWNALRLTLI